MGLRNDLKIEDSGTTFHVPTGIVLFLLESLKRTVEQ